MIRLTPALACLAVAGCAGSCPPPTLVEPVYCYQRLTDIVCQETVDPGHDGQITGVYLRRLDDPTQPDYWLRRAAGRP